MNPALEPVREQPPSGLGPVSIVCYLTLNWLWVYLRPRTEHFHTEPVDAAFLGSICLYLGWIGRTREIRQYLVGRWWPERRHRWWLLLLPSATLAWFVATGFDHSAVASFEPIKTIDDMVTSPVTEEIVFRGVLLSVLFSQTSLNRHASILLGAAMFASVHGPETWQRLVTITGGGLVLGYGFAVTRCVPLCVVSHSLWNAGTRCPFLQGSWG